MLSLRSGGPTAYFVTDPLSEGSAYSSIREVLRGAGLWGLYQGWQGKPYFASQGYLLNGWVVLLTLFAPVLALLGIARGFRSSNIRYLGVLLGISVIMGVAIYPVGDPTAIGHIYLWLYDHVFFFRAFRSNYKWVSLIAFCYALLLPRVASVSNPKTGSMSRALGRWIRGVIWLALFVVIGAYSFPFASGLVFTSSYKVGTIPSYWYRAATWLDSQPRGGRVLFLPMQGFSVYQWGSPLGDISQYLIKRPVLSPQIAAAVPSQTQAIFDLLGEAPSDRAIPFVKILNLFNVRYVVQRNDINWTYYGSPSPTEMKRFLGGQNELRLVRQFGKLSIYRVGHSLPGPLFSSRNIDSVVFDGSLIEALNAYHANVLTTFTSSELYTRHRIGVTSSSVWRGLTDVYGAGQVVFGNPQLAWVPNPPSVGQWLEMHFGERISLPKVTVIPRKDGSDAVPTVLDLVINGTRHAVPIDSEGRFVLSLHHTWASSIRITIARIGRGGPNVGISEVRIPGVTPNYVDKYPIMSGLRPVQYLFDLSGGRKYLIHEFRTRRSLRVQVSGRVRLSASATSRQLARLIHVKGIASITASGRWHNLAAYDPIWSIAGVPGMTWVGNSYNGVGQWIQFRFSSPRNIRSILLVGRNNGVDAEASSISVTVDGRAVSTQRLRWSAGVANVPINASGSSLRLTILSSFGGAISHNTGFDVEIPGITSVLSSGSSPIELNGSHVPIFQGSSRLEATVLEELLNRGVPFARWLSLSPGNQLFSVNGFSPLEIGTLQLAQGSRKSASLAPLAVYGASLDRLSSAWGDSHDRYLVLLNTYDSLWRAKVGSTTLGRQVLVDGYGQAWQSSVRAGRIRLTFDAGLSTGTWLWIWTSSLAGSALLGLIVRIVVRMRIEGDLK